MSWGQMKATDIWQDSELLIFLVESAQLQESWETARVLVSVFLDLSKKFYFVKL